jgi:hypothetical protein
MLGPVQFAQGCSRKFSLYFKHLHEHDRPVTGIPVAQASIGAAVEFWTRANTGLAGV